MSRKELIAWWAVALAVAYTILFATCAAPRPHPVSPQPPRSAEAIAIVKRAVGSEPNWLKFDVNVRFGYDCHMGGGVPGVMSGKGNCWSAFANLSNQWHVGWIDGQLFSNSGLARAAFDAHMVYLHGFPDPYCRRMSCDERERIIATANARLWAEGL